MIGEGDTEAELRAARRRSRPPTSSAARPSRPSCSRAEAVVFCLVPDRGRAARDLARHADRAPGGGHRRRGRHRPARARLRGDRDPDHDAAAVCALLAGYRDDLGARGRRSGGARARAADRRDPAVVGARAEALLGGTPRPAAAPGGALPAAAAAHGAEARVDAVKADGLGLHHQRQQFAQQRSPAADRTGSGCAARPASSSPGSWPSPRGRPAQDPQLQPPPKAITCV